MILTVTIETDDRLNDQEWALRALAALPWVTDAKVYELDPNTEDYCPRCGAHADSPHDDECPDATFPDALVAGTALTCGDDLCNDPIERMTEVGNPGRSWHVLGLTEHGDVNAFDNGGGDDDGAGIYRLWCRSRHISNLPGDAGIAWDGFS